MHGLLALMLLFDLSGTAQWDFELVREYFSKAHGVQIAANVTFQNDGMLAHVNPEFAKRIRAMMAVYRAHGGRTGIIAQTGGLRDMKMQREIYGQGRMAIQGPSLEGPPLVPQGPEDYAPRPGAKPPTQAWVSWHNLGLAVDVSVPGVIENPFIQLLDAAGALGMECGAWYKGYKGWVVDWYPSDPVTWVTTGTVGDLRKEKPIRHFQLGWDQGHVEWHPRWEVPAGVPGSTPGAAMRDDQMHAGYAWKIPESIYRIDPDRLWAYQLASQDNMLVCPGFREIVGDPRSDDWTGHWVTFSPPVPLFPVYIPTKELSRNPTRWPEDRRFQGQTQVTHEFYNHRAGKPERGTFQFGWAYTPELRMTDHEKSTNHLLKERRPSLSKAAYDAERQRYAEVLSNSVYDIELQVGHSAPSRFTYKRRTVEPDGFTDDDQTSGESPSMMSVYLGFSWNRDQGKIGHLLSNGAAQMRVVPVLEGLTWSGTVPADAAHRDVAQAPPWPAPHPRPSPRPRPDDGGFIRP